MSQENVEIVRNLYRAWDAGDRDAVVHFADPEVVVDATRRVFNPATYVGVEGVRQWWTDMDEIWQEFRTENLEFIDAGDRVVVSGRLVGKGKASGVEVEQPIATVWTLRAGRVVRWEMGYNGPREALEAVGLSEQDAHADS
jgi:ketosteroid isomerase-like protein